jgi:hypothetical protein
MRLGLSFRDQLLAHLHRKWEIGQPAAVQMSELAASEAELDAAESMRLDPHAFPPADFAFDTRDEVRRRHVSGHLPSLTGDGTDSPPNRE